MNHKKRLFVVSLCFLLVIIPLTLNTNEKEEPPKYEGFFEDGIYFDPIIPEIPQLNYSTPEQDFTVTTLGSEDYPLHVPGLRDEPGDGIITLYVLMAYDDDFLSHNYETAKDGILSAREYAIHRTFRAFVWFYALYNIRLQICGEVTWRSDSSTDEGMFYELIEETDFRRGMNYNDCEAQLSLDGLLNFSGFQG